MKRLAVAIAVLVLAAWLEMATGQAGFGVPDFFTESGLRNPIFELRFLRTLAALTVGGALAVSGMILQAVLRNPLADPFILGISGGAAAGAGVVMFTGLAAVSALAVSIGSFAGAAGVLFLVLWLARGDASGERMLLSGVMAGAVAGAVLMCLTAFADDTRKVAGLAWWMLGDLQIPRSEMLYPAMAVTLGGTLTAYVFSRSLNAVALGRESAFYVGCNADRTIRNFVLLAALMTAMTVSLAGIIGFCGLVVPHMVRRLAGGENRSTVWLTFVWGAIFLALADSLAGGLIPGMELPLGVVTTLAGGPVFLWILNRREGRLEN